MKKAAWSAIAAILLLAGCGSKGVAGRWQAKSIDPPSTTEIGRKLDQLKLKSTLDFGNNGSVSLGVGSMKSTGTYKANGNSIEVTLPGIGGTEPSVTTYELSSDGRTLTRTEKGSTTKVTFERG